MKFSAPRNGGLQSAENGNEFFPHPRSSFCGSSIGFGDRFSQEPQSSGGDAVRVTMSMHPDGSRTVYKFDNAQHKAIATTTDPDGKLRETIRYELDDAGRFSSGEISGPDGRFRLKSRYKYDDAGRHPRRNSKRRRRHAFAQGRLQLRCIGQANRLFRV